MKLILALLAMLATLFTFVEAGKCPSTHPYPYLYGSYCCRHDKTCHGAAISFSKKCCKDNNFINCPSGVCKNTYGVENKCPSTHPYPYLYGSYCCRYDKTCHGTAIGYSQKCCKDNNFITCPSGVCKNTYSAGECPSTHPYPYLNGASCCKVETTCHNTHLSYESKCCKSNNYIFCPTNHCKRRDPCKTHNGGCSQICKSEGSAVLCSCKHGYKLKSDGKTCVIIDPCQTSNGGCSQICKSEGAAVLCSCNKGFKLNKDGKACDKVCKGVADLGFVLDSSGSLANHYQDEKNFLKSLTRSFGISEHGSHAGVVTFSTETELSIKFNQYHTQVSFDRAVDNIHHMNGFTFINKALTQAKNELFSVKNGARPNVPRLCVLITDGTQTKLANSGPAANIDPATIAEEIRAMGIKTIAVGVGKDDVINQAELIRIAGSSKDAYTAANFHILTSSAFANKVKQAMCREKESG